MIIYMNVLTLYVKNNSNVAAGIHRHVIDLQSSFRS